MFATLFLMSCSYTSAPKANVVIKNSTPEYYDLLLAKYTDGNFLFNTPGTYTINFESITKKDSTLGYPILEIKQHNTISVYINDFDITNNQYSILSFAELDTLIINQFDTISHIPSKSYSTKNYIGYTDNVCIESLNIQTENCYTNLNNYSSSTYYNIYSSPLFTDFDFFEHTKYINEFFESLIDYDSNSDIEIIVDSNIFGYYQTTINEDNSYLERSMILITNWNNYSSPCIINDNLTYSNNENYSYSSKLTVKYSTPWELIVSINF